ncbi:hypothetical protein [Dictyobacter arantiisoli]|uniref:hypothetical protein n=1 Tax=Dictyobacter arantiisoli TaxID=2014874 RepID=UPI0011EED46C|nr:hypothetical protein [Dictyobacter arantiisoli]
MSIPAVAGFYQAIKARNYTLAYSYLTDNATTEKGQRLTKDVFIQMAKAADGDNGPVTDVLINPGSTDSTSMVTTIDRSTHLHYHSHLTLKKDGKLWKIVFLDRI